MVLSIIIPACNEERRIKKGLEQYVHCFSEKFRDDFEILVIVNGCTDNTQKVIEEYANKFPQIWYKVFRDRIGKGGAIIEGFRIARGDIVSFTDADGATSPDELLKLVLALGEDDAVIGSRWLAESNIVVKQTLLRRMTSRVFNLFVRLLFWFPYRDTQCGAKVVRKSALDGILSELVVTNFAFDVELLHRLSKGGFKVKEVPITWKDKGGSTLSVWRAAPTMFLAVLRLRALDSPAGFLLKWLRL